MTFDEYAHQWSVLHGGYVPKRHSLVGRYLQLMYTVASPFAKARIHPDAVSIGAVLVVALAPWAVTEDRVLLAAGLIAITGLLDGVDGAVAVLRRKVSSWGSVLDSSADRVSEVIYVVALIAAGAPDIILVVGLVVTLLQEYVRAKAGAVGAKDIGVVSVWERPTRIALAAMTLIGFVVTSSHMVLHTSAWVWLGLALIGLTQVSRAMRAQLSASIASD